MSPFFMLKALSDIPLAHSTSPVLRDTLSEAFTMSDLQQTFEKHNVKSND